MSKRILLVLFFLLTIRGWGQTPAPKVLLGILPVFDASGERHGEILGPHITAMLFAELQSSAVQPTLLNPGGLYSPIYKENVQEYAREAGVDVVVITSLLSTEKPRSGDWTLRAESQLMDVRTGKTTDPRLSTHRMDRRYLIMSPTQRLGFWGTPVGFDRQPLGNAARALAEQLRTHVLAEAPVVASAHSAAPAAAPGTGSCEIRFQVVYRETKQVSKAYGLIVNGKEESLGMQDGVTRLPAPAGTIVVRVQLSDAPYRVPAQRVYQANSTVDCAQPERTLMLEIGGGGEALLRWQ